MKKRVLSMALCLVMLASVLPMSAFSTEDGATAATDTGAVTATATVAPADAGATNAPAKTDAPMNTDAPAKTDTPAKTDAPANTDTPVNTDESAAGDDDTSDPTGKAEPAPTDEPAPTPEATDAPEVDEAVAAVQELIDALPSAEDMTALVTAYLKGEEPSEADSAALTEAYGKLDAAAEAYYALTDAQREQVDSARLEQLAALFNSEVEPLAEGDGDYVAEIVRDNGNTIHKYVTLLALQNNLNNNDTVRFLKAPVTGGNLQIKGSGVKNVTIDLNGVDASNIQIQIDSKNLTIKDNSGKTGSIKVSNQFLTEGVLTVEGGNVTFTGTIKTINVTGSNVTVEDADGFSGDTKVGSINVNGGSLTIKTGANIGTANVDTLGVSNGNVDIKSGIISTLNVNNSTVDIAPGTVKDCNINGNNAILKGAAPTGEEIYNVENLTVSHGDVKINFTEATNNYFFNVENLTVNPFSGSAIVDFNSGKINSVDVSGGTLTINGGTVNLDGQRQNGYLTVTGGTVDIKGGKIYGINLGGKNGTGGNGTVNISPSVQLEDPTLAPITGLYYYDGTLNFSGSFNSQKRVIDELYVKSDGLNGTLSGGVFWQIHSDNNRKLSRLLADNCVIVDQKNSIVDASNISDTIGQSKYTAPYYICNHNNATADKDGKCSVCSTQFEIVGTREGAASKLYKTASDFFSDKLIDGYTYTLYTDLGSAEANVTPYSDSNISVTFNLNGHSVSGTMVLGNGTNTLSLAITGAGDLSGLAFTVKDGSGLDLSDWTGDASESGKGLTLGGLDMSGISSTNAQKIKVKPGMTITTFSGPASVQLKDWLKGSETAGAPWLRLTKGGVAQSALTDLDSLSNATVTIAECKTHSIIKDSPNEGMCDYCGHNFVASLTTGAGESKTTTCYETFQSALNAAATADAGAVVTLLSNNPTAEERDQFGVTGGTFTLDFNGKSVDKTVNVKEGNVTIKSSGTGTSTVVALNVGVNAEVADKADVTVESGKFGSIGVHNKGNLTFNGGTVEPDTSGKDSVFSITGGTATVNGGTISKIDVGSNQSEAPGTISPNATNLGNGKLSVTGGTVGALNYFSGTSVTLKGGKFGSINGNPAGYDATENKGNYDIFAKNVIDFLGDGFAYYTTASGEDIVNTVDIYGNQLKALNESDKTYYVREHTCSYLNADNELYPKCACGRVCRHDGEADTDGKCGVCGKQLPIKETDGKGNLVRFLLQFPESDPLNNGHTYTLMADVTGDNVSLTSTEADEITINLNGHKFVPKSDVATGVTLDVSFVSATVAITGEGDLSNVTFKLNVGSNSTLDLSGWLGATDANGLTIAVLDISGTTDDINITLKEGLVFSKIAFAETSLPGTGGQGSSPVSFTAGSILKNSGFKLVTVTETGEDNVEYNNTIGDAGDDNKYKVVKCTHTDAEHDLNGIYSCKHCGQLMTVKVTAGTGAGATTYYTDIAEAFDYAKDKPGCTVELLDDCTATAPLTANGTFTLDLRGYKLTLNNGNGNLNVTGDLAIASSRKERDESSELNNGKINGTVTVADSAKLTVSNKVKGQTSGLETCTPEIAKLTVSGGDVKLSGGKFGSVNVTGGKLSVTNVTDGANVNGVRQETTCIPEISTLTVNGGDVKLSGGKYSEVYYNGNKLGDLLDDTENVKYGFKNEDKGKSVWHDSTWIASSFDSGDELGISVEKLPIQSVTTDPADGKKAITFGGELTLKITEINGEETLLEAAGFRWYRTANSQEANLGATEKVYSNNQYTSTSGETEIYCDVTVDGYTKTVKFDVMVEAKNLTEEDINQISPPARAGSVYEPVLTTNGVYNGEGKPKSLMASVPTNNKDPLDLNKNGCIYEFKLAGEDEWKSAGDLKRSDAGEYEVYWRLNGKGRYKFDGKPCYECPTPITAEIKPLTIDSVTVSDATKVYDGNTDLPTEAGKVTLNWTVSGPNGDETHSLTIGDGATGMVKLAFDSKDVGTGKTVTATLKSNSTLSKNFRFTSQDTPLVASTEGEITAAKLTVTAESYDIFIGESAPSLANPVPGTHYTISGYFESEKTEILASLNGRIALDYYDENATVKTTPNTSIESKYAIVPSLKENSTFTPTVFALTNGETQSDVLDNYELSFANGMPTVSEKPEYTITVIYGYNGTVAGPNGIIASPGTVTVKQGETPTFTITPNPGYVVASVKVDGVNYGSISTYTFPPIIDNHTIEATFMLPWGNPQTGVDVD